MKPRQIVGIIVAESLSLALLAVFIGLALGGLLSWYLVEVGLDLFEKRARANRVQNSSTKNPHLDIGIYHDSTDPHNEPKPNQPPTTRIKFLGG